MIPTVFDTGTVVAAVFWPRSTARRAWTRVARRIVRPCVTEPIEREYRATCLEFQRRSYPERSPVPFLEWIRAKALHCLPLSLGKPRSRDPGDDSFLACALAAQARFIVTSDRDLLALGKPFGVAVVTPLEFLKWTGTPG